VHPETGTTHGWILTTDEWVPLDDTLSRAGSGFRLITNASPIAIDDRDGDGVPDILLSASTGYQWMNGRNGTHLSDIQRPLATNLHFLYPTNDGLLALESNMENDGRLYRFGPLDGEPRWTLHEDDLQADFIVRLGDFTGDGAWEILSYTFERIEYPPMEMPSPGQLEQEMPEPERVPPRWMVRTPTSDEPLWEHEPPGDGPFQLAIVPNDNGPLRLAVIDRDEALKIQLHDITRSDPVWTKTYDEKTTYRGSHGGHFLLQHSDEDNEETRLSVHRYKNADQVHQVTIGPEQRYLWAGFVSQEDDPPHFIYSYADLESGAPRPSGDQEPPEARQIIRLHDPAGARIASLTTVDIPGAVSYDTENDRWSISPAWSGPGYRVSGYNGLITGWTGDAPALMLREEGRTTVRSLDTGDLLAVGPKSGDVRLKVDLNGDGRQEVALRNHERGTLTLHAYDPTHVEKDEEATGRLDLRTQGNQTRDLDDFFDDDRRSPGPSMGLLLLLVTGWALARRGHKRDRDD
jgi:hypothetical protein